jgi:hypothetical protein
MVLFTFRAFMLRSIDFLVASTGKVSRMGASTTHLCPTFPSFVYVFVFFHLNILLILLGQQVNVRHSRFMGLSFFYLDRAGFGTLHLAE